MQKPKKDAPFLAGKLKTNHLQKPKKDVSFLAEKLIGRVSLGAHFLENDRLDFSNLFRENFLERNQIIGLFRYSFGGNAKGSKLMVCVKSERSPL